MSDNMKSKIKPINISKTDAMQQLSHGSILLTHSPQLASDWKYRYAQQQEQSACPTPRIYTWSAWLSELFQHTSKQICLKNLPELLLWQQVIHDDLPHMDDSTIRGLARQASQAYTLMQNYQIPTAELLQAGGDEAQALARWLDAIHCKLQTNAYKIYILKADITAALLKHTPHIPSSNIIVDGFESFTPAQQKHLQAYLANDISLFQVQRQQSTPQISLNSHQDEHAELQYIALQSKAIIAEQPDAHIAIISEHINTSELQRLMQLHLQDDGCLHPQTETQSITMSGESLADTAMLQQALHLLQLCSHKELSFDEFSILLFCPWLRGFTQERMQRARLDALFRQQNRHRLTLKSLLQSSSLETTPAFKKVIENMYTWQQNKPQTQSSQHWIQSALQLLQSSGFMQAGLKNESVRSGYEVQLMNNLQEQLSSLIALDAIQENFTWSQFLSYLRNQCSETPASKPISFPNITLLSMRQAVGISFDYIFIHGMDDSNIPPITRPQSLLPLRLQQDYHIPASHATWLFESYQWLWQHMQYCAPHINVSYALLRDEQSMQACSFIQHLNAQYIESELDTIPAWQCEALNDSQYIPVRDHKLIRGGTSIIKHQSACPFRAFAIHRLRIEVLGETSAGIEASNQGTLIHLALEYIWQHLLSQQKLLDMDDEQRHSLIKNSIEHACQAHQKPIDFRTQNIEKKRMLSILQQWLALECTRPAFQIEALEKTYQLCLPSDSQTALKITIKADRMDKDVHGNRLLIDYKTGQKQSPQKWLGERMAEPQLPMYAIAATLGSHDAVSFANIRSGKDMGFTGLSGDKLEIKGLTCCDGKRNNPDDWQYVLDSWKLQLDNLASEFLQGKSDVAPRDSHACDYCQLEDICRIDELHIKEKS